MASRWVSWALRIGAVVGAGYLIVRWLQRPAGDREVWFRGSPGNRVFHAPACRYFDALTSAEEFATRQDAIDAGYAPCKICNP